MKIDLYFTSRDEELCYPKSYFEAIMDYEGWNEMTVYKAKKQLVKGFFYCKHFEMMGEKSEGWCGRECKAYAPRNGKNGCCKHYSLKFYEPSDETLIIRKKNDSI